MKKKTLKQIKQELEQAKYKQRDINIQKHIKREIDLSTKKVESKKKYSRKIKHKKKVFESFSKDFKEFLLKDLTFFEKCVIILM